jgi:hypothetical protein
VAQWLRTRGIEPTFMDFAARAAQAAPAADE